MLSARISTCPYDLFVCLFVWFGFVFFSDEIHTKFIFIKERFMNHGGIFILCVIIIIFASILRLSTGQPEPLVKLFEAYCGCLGQTDMPYVTRWYQAYFILSLSFQIYLGTQ